LQHTVHIVLQHCSLTTTNQLNRTLPSDTNEEVSVEKEYRSESACDSDVVLPSTQHNNSFNRHDNQNNQLYWYI